MTPSENLARIEKNMARVAAMGEVYMKEWRKTNAKIMKLDRIYKKLIEERMLELLNQDETGNFIHDATRTAEQNLQTKKIIDSLTSDVPNETN